jgi:hypothetical protein
MILEFQSYTTSLLDLQVVHELYVFGVEAALYFGAQLYGHSVSQLEFECSGDCAARVVLMVKYCFIQRLGK